MSQHDEHTHSDQGLVSGEPDRDLEEHNEFASAKAFTPLAVPGLGVPHPASAIASAEHIESETPEPHSHQPSREENEPGLEHRR